MMSLPESPVGTAVLLGIVSAVSIHAYVLLRRLQVSFDIWDSPSLSYELVLQFMDKYQSSSPWYLRYQFLGAFYPVFLRLIRASLGNGMSAKRVCTCSNILENFAYICLSAYLNHSHDVVSFVPLLTGKPCIYTCSVDVMRQVLGNEIKAGLVKPPDMTMDT